MYTLGFRFKPWTSATGDRRRPVDPGLPQGGRRRERHRQAHAVRPQGARRRLVRRRQPLELTVERGGEEIADQLRVPVRLQRLLQLRRGLLARVRRRRGLRRHHRAPAALARGPRLPGQEDRRDRQWRHRRHPDPRADRQRRRATSRCCSARRPTSARCPTRTRSPRGPTSCCPRRRPTRSIRWKAISRSTGQYQLARMLPEASSARRCAPWPSGGCRRATTSTSTSARATSPWDQRVCLAPNGDLFKAIRKGKADVVTDTIERFTPTGIKLTSGERARRRHHRHRNGFEHAAVRRCRDPRATASRST